MVDRAVSVEDGGAAAVAGYLGQQGEGSPENARAAHYEVPSGNLSGEGTVDFFILTVIFVGPL